MRAAIHSISFVVALICVAHIGHSVHNESFWHFAVLGISATTYVQSAKEEWES